MCMIDDADGCEVQRTYDVKRSRKDAKCSECRRVIAKGESYKRTEMVMEGRWYTFRICQHCQVSCKWLSDQCGGYLFEGVFEDIMEHAAVYRIARLKRLEIGMRRKWQRFDGIGLMPIPQVPHIVEKRAH